MRFETKKDVLDWYEKQPRTLNKKFIDKISEGLDWIDRNVTKRLQVLPGFDGLTKISDKIGQIALAENSAI